MFKRDDTIRHLSDGGGGRSVQLERGGIWLRNHYGVTVAGGIAEMFLPRDWAESLAAEIIAYYADLDAAA